MRLCSIASLRSFRKKDGYVNIFLQRLPCVGIGDWILRTFQQGQLLRFTEANGGPAGMFEERALLPTARKRALQLFLDGLGCLLVEAK